MRNISVLIALLFLLACSSEPKTAESLLEKDKMTLNYYSASGAYLLMTYLLIQVVDKYNMNLVEAFMFGFSLYGVYDLTCGSIFNNWDFGLALIDMIWGGIVYMLAVFIMSKV